MTKHLIGIVSVVCIFFLLIACGDSSDDTRIAYVALGASDAVGIGANPPSDGYVFLIDNRLARDCQPVDLTNLGIPATGLDSVISVQLPVTEEIGADLVTLWPGPNDLIDGQSVPEFNDELQEVVRTLLEETGAEIFLATIPDLTKIPRFQESPDPNVSRERVNAFNAVIRDIAAAHGRVRIVELAGISVEPEYVNDLDGFHPSNRGHSVIADLFLEQIRPVFCQ